MAAQKENYPKYKVRGSTKLPKMKIKDTPKSKPKVTKVNKRTSK